MLVLSRGRNDKIVFPNLGITVEILNIASNKVRVGVDAPPSVTVLRHELAGEAGPAAQAESLNPARKLSHEIRNRLARRQPGAALVAETAASQSAGGRRTDAAESAR